MYSPHRIIGTYGEYSEENRIPFDAGLSPTQLQGMIADRGFNQPKPNPPSEVEYEIPEIPEDVQEAIQAKIEEHYAQIVEENGEPG